MWGRWCKPAVTLLCASAAWRGSKPSSSRRQAGTQARQIQQLSFTLLLLLALLYPIALTATSLSLPSHHTHTVPPEYQWDRGGRWPLSSNCRVGRSGKGLRLLSSLQVRRLGEGAGGGLHCGFALTTGTDPPTQTSGLLLTGAHTNPHSVNKTKATNMQAYGKILTMLWLCFGLHKIKMNGNRYNIITLTIPIPVMAFKENYKLLLCANYKHWHISTLYALLNN